MMRSWTFQEKLTIGFAILAGLAVLIGVISVYAIQAVVASNNRLVEINAMNLTDAANLQASASDAARAFHGFTLLEDESFLAQGRDSAYLFGEVLHRLNERVYTPEEHRLLSEIQKLQADLVAVQERIIRLQKNKAGKNDVIRAVEEQALPARERMAGTIKVLAASELALLEKGKRECTAAASLASMVLVGLAAGTALFATLAAMMLGRALSRQIGSAVQHVQSSSAELQGSANQQATGARETATAMSEVTTTMSELVATSRQIAESAQQVARIAEETAHAARSGDQTVLTTQDSIEGIRRQVNLIVGHMLDLGKKSQQIGSVVDIINELAEQTNILSINATIEAAGAGEQGRRFAVVGDEIRKLANRVSNSAREIRSLVEEIRGAVNTTVLTTEVGSKAVDAGMHHFEEVTRGFKQIAGLVITTTQAAREIELSTKQQMTAVEQANSAIAGAAQASRETETSCTQTLQTATQLAQLSRDLSFIVQDRAA